MQGVTKEELNGVLGSIEERIGDIPTWLKYGGYLANGLVFLDVIVFLVLLIVAFEPNGTESAGFVALIIILIVFILATVVFLQRLNLQYILLPEKWKELTSDVLKRENEGKLGGLGITVEFNSVIYDEKDPKSDTKFVETLTTVAFRVKVKSDGEAAEHDAALEDVELGL
eukprot:TRINITY_DN2399_c0_g1_i1.p2 TRINITY_DN2399_c0_g1~~TRINITY_DN2399_c0_g1_i1.p2  ORF type:complete len:170 (+),score=50.63 TRINITY_DN2399_c0_g1_i1:75-584(+)